MQFHVLPDRVRFSRSKMLYGHFLEHFHRQVYGGIYDPGSPLSGEDGLRQDVVKALVKIGVPVIRWPGGCFVSDYHWQDGVGRSRSSVFNRAWRVEEPNTFGTDEFIGLCRRLDCQPYICTNAGTGSAEEMSGWVEYCNLERGGRNARLRMENGHEHPFGVTYWSIGNENYGSWEIGAKTSGEWGSLVAEAAKMMKRTDPRIQLSAAALDDVEWNVSLLKKAGPYLDWISIHRYWDSLVEKDDPADYPTCVAYTGDLDTSIRRVRGLLTAMGLDRQIKIAFDEWNLRSWHHPNIMTVRQGTTPSEYLLPRDRNDLNQTYTMADAVFSACFLNALLRNADIVGMANFAPAVNTRGAIFTHEKGIVLRATYHVFDMYVNKMGEEVLDAWLDSAEPYRVTGKGGPVDVDCVDLVATLRRADDTVVVAAVNKHARESRAVAFRMEGFAGRVRVTTLCGDSVDAYNDIGFERRVAPFENDSIACVASDGVKIDLPAHSVNIVEFLR